MLFREVVGQQKLKQRLIQSVKENRISHAQLFVGAEGCGSLALALAYAQYVSCENKQQEDSCGSCTSCTKYQKLIHPDLHFVYPVATTKSVTKDPVSDDFIKEWRECILSNPYLGLARWYEAIGVENKQGIINKFESAEIVRKLNLKTFEADYKVMIIWLPEKMNHVAANKLLKMLEEPPEKTLFLLVAENTSLMLQTILSRCQLIKVPKIDSDSMLKALVAKHNISEPTANSISKIANGNFLVALETMDEQNQDNENFNLFIKLMRLCYARDIPDLVYWADDMSMIGREKQKSFLNYAIRLIRENFMLTLDKREIAFLTDQEMNFSEKFSPFINIENIFQITTQMEKAHYDIERNAYAKIVFLDMALNVVKVIRNT